MELFRDSHFSTIYDSQKIFRVLLDSLARPGKINRLPQISLAAPGGVNPYVLAIFRTFLDQQVSLAVLADQDSLRKAVEDYLVLNTGCFTADITLADFICCLNGDSHGAVLRLKRGSSECPEASATILYQVESMSGTGREIGRLGDLENRAHGESRIVGLRLSGPGILDERELWLQGFGLEEVENLIATRAAFPLGVDALIVDRPGKIVGLPRTTKITL